MKIYAVKLQTHVQNKNFLFLYELIARKKSKRESKTKSSCFQFNAEAFEIEMTNQERVKCARDNLRP